MAPLPGIERIWCINIQTKNRNANLEIIYKKKIENFQKYDSTTVV